MIVLPAGTPKFLLLNPSEIDRNYQRKTTGGPIAMVAEPDPHYGHRVTHGYGVLAEGPVILAYNQVGIVAQSRDPYTNVRADHRAAYMTNGRVFVAETREEAGTLALPADPVPDATNDAPDLSDAPKAKKESKR